MGDELRIGALQMQSGVSVDDNLAAVRKGVAEAREKGASYILTPEVTLAFAGNREELSRIALPFDDDPALSALAQIARDNAILLHVGSMAVALENGLFANRSVLFTPEGEIGATYDKVHLFDADPPGDRPYRESDTYQGGHQACVADIGALRLGLSICYDVRFPALYAALAEAGANVLCVPAAFTVPTGRAHWEVLLRARAIETGSYVIAAAQGGAHENGRRTYGHSMIIDPWGAIIAERKDDMPGLILADIDPERVKEARARVPALVNRRSFSLSVNQVNPNMVQVQEGKLA